LFPVVNFLIYVVTEVVFSVVALDIDISQDSVATQWRCGGTFSDSTITNFLLILTVKKVRKSINIWWSYKAYKNVPNFLRHLYIRDSRCQVPVSPRSWNETETKQFQNCSKLFCLSFISNVQTVLYCLMTEERRC